MDQIENKQFMEDFATTVAQLYSVSIEQVGKLIQETFPDARIQLQQSNKPISSSDEEFSEQNEEEDNRISEVNSPLKRSPKDKPKQARKAQNRTPRLNSTQQKTILSPQQYNSENLRLPKLSQALNPYMQLWIENQNYEMLDNIIPISQMKGIIVNLLKPLKRLYKVPVINFLQQGNQRLLMFPLYDQQFKTQIPNISFLNKQTFEQVLYIDENSYTDEISTFYVDSNNQLCLQDEKLDQNKLVFIMGGSYVHKNDSTNENSYFITDDEEIKVLANKNSLIQLPQDFITLGSAEDANVSIQTVNYNNYPVVCLVASKVIEQNQPIILDQKYFVEIKDQIRLLQNGSTSDMSPLQAKSLGKSQFDTVLLQSSCIQQLEIPTIGTLFFSDIIYQIYNQLIVELENSASWTYQTRNLNTNEIFEQKRLYYYYNGSHFENNKAFFDQQQELFSTLQDNQLDESTMLVSITDITSSRQNLAGSSRTFRRHDATNKGKYHLEEQYSIMLCLLFDLLNLDGIDHLTVGKQMLQPIIPCNLLGFYS